MEFFDKLGDTLLNAGKDVTQKAKDVSGIAKLKLDIHSKEDFIKSQYTELGKIYYEKNKGADVPEKEQFERIEEALEEIAKMQLQILELKKAKKCPACGAEASDKAEYCSACGAKLSVVVEDESPYEDESENVPCEDATEAEGVEMAVEKEDTAE